jgi:hypothetical protein
MKRRRLFTDDTFAFDRDSRDFRLGWAGSEDGRVQKLSPLRIAYQDIVWLFSEALRAGF